MTNSDPESRTACVCDSWDDARDYIEGGGGERAIVFTVLGKPRTAGSKTSFVPKKGDGSLVRRGDGAPMVVTKDSAGVEGEQWRNAVAEKGLVALVEVHQAAGTGGLLDGPLAMEVTYFFQRPKSHYGTGRNAGVLKDSAPAFPAKKPDVGKLTRAIHDALTGVVYGDDAQIVDNCEHKRFGTPERAEVRLFRPAISAEDRRPEQAALAL